MRTLQSARLRGPRGEIVGPADVYAFAITRRGWLARDTFGVDSGRNAVTYLVTRWLRTRQRRSLSPTA